MLRTIDWRRGVALGLGLVAMLLLATLGGCNTVAGVGQDVSAAGQGVSKAADKVKQSM